MQPKTNSTKTKNPQKKDEAIQIQVMSASIINIKPGGKYLLVLPKDAQINKIAPAVAKFFDPIPVFVLAVNEVTDVKIAELLDGEQNAK